MSAGHIAAEKPSWARVQTGYQAFENAADQNVSGTPSRFAVDVWEKSKGMCNLLSRLEYCKADLYAIPAYPQGRRSDHVTDLSRLREPCELRIM